jgi:hypothetical protein
MRLAFLVIALAAGITCSAAAAAEPEPFPEPVGAPATPPNSRMIGLVLEAPIYSFYLGSPNIHGEAYVPNFIPRLGPQLSWNGFGGRMTFSLPIPQKEIDRRGESEQTNFLFNFYWSRFAVNFYYQHFKGFYVASPFTEVSSSRPKRYTQLPEATAQHWGFNLYLKSDLSKYGFDTAFDENKLDLVPGADWVYVPFFRHWRIDLGDKIIPGTDSDSLQTIPDVRAGTFDTAGVALGYSKTWIWGRYFSSGLGSLGPAAQLQKYHDSGNEFSKVTLAGKLNLKVSAGVKSRNTIWGAQVMMDTLYSHIAGTEIYSTLASAELFVNRRF